MNGKWIAIVLAVLIAVLAGCEGNPVRHKVEKSVEQSLPALIGPAQSYSVKAYGSTVGMVSGKLSGLDIIGLDVRLPNGVNVARLNAKLTNITFDSGSKEIKSVEKTEYTASLTEAEVTRYMREKHPGIAGLNVALADRNIRVSARPGVSVLRTAVQADADLEIRENRILALDLKKVKVAGVHAPDFALDFLGSKLGVIFDANDLGFEAKIRSVVIGPGSLTLVGDLDLMKVVERQKAAGTPRTPTASP